MKCEDLFAEIIADDLQILMVKLRGGALGQRAKDHRPRPEHINSFEIERYFPRPTLGVKVIPVVNKEFLFTV